MSQVKQVYQEILEKFSRDGQIRSTEIKERMEQCFVKEGYRTPHAGAQRILVVRLDEIGDNVLSSAFLRELRRNLPEAEIDLLVKPVSYPLMELCPYVHRVLSAEGMPRENRLEDLFRWFGRICEDELWARHYDICFVPRWDIDETWSALLSFICGAKERIGFSAHVYNAKAAMDQGGDQFFTHTIMTPPYVVHEVEKSLYLLKACGFSVEKDGIELWLSQEDMDAAKALLPTSLPHGYLAVAVGTREKRKTYPADRLAQALKLLLPAGVPFVLLGGPGEEADAAYIEQQLPTGSVCNLVGRTPLRVSAALVSMSRLYLGGDTGLTHIAAAAKRPIIEWNCWPADVIVSAIGAFPRFFPWQAAVTILRPARALGECKNIKPGLAELAGCQAVNESHCISTIAPQKIADATMAMLQQEG